MHQGSGHEERTEQGRRGRERAEDEEGNTGERQAAGGQGRDTQQATEKKKKKKRTASRQSGQQLEAARSSRGSSSGRDNGWVVVIHQVHPAAQPNPFGLREERGARQRSGQEDGRQGALRPRRGARPPLCHAPCHGRPAMQLTPPPPSPFQVSSPLRTSVERGFHQKLLDMWRCPPMMQVSVERGDFKKLRVRRANGQGANGCLAGRDRSICCTTPPESANWTTGPSVFQRRMGRGCQHISQRAPPPGGQAMRSVGIPLGFAFSCLNDYGCSSLNFGAPPNS